MHIALAVVAILSAIFCNLPAAQGVRWPRGCTKPCGSLMTPGRAYRWRRDETDHCFPENNSDHMVCCTHIQNPRNIYNRHDRWVAYRNPLYGPIMRNSRDHNNLSWCTCSVSICINQLNGTVEWDRC